MKNIFLFLLLTGIGSVSMAQEQPAADVSAIVLAGNARFTILTPELVRMEWNNDGKFVNRASQVVLNRKLPIPVFQKSVDGNKLKIRTEKLLIEYTIGPDSFTNQNLKVSARNEIIPFVWKPGMQDSGNLRGTMRTLDGKDGGDLSLLENGILSKSGWSVINDSKSYLFDSTGWIMPRQTNGQDWYFFGHGHNYKKALKDFINISGKIPMPPRFAFGYWWSRYWIYGEKEMKDLVTNFKELDIPIDVMIIDMDWHETYGFRGNATVDDGQGSIVGWTGYTWNRNIFPEPAKFLKWMEDHQIKNALNLHPAAGIPPMEEKYSAFARAYNFDTSAKAYIPYYGSDKKWSRTYFDTILHPFEKMGVDFWWLDWQQYPNDRLQKSLSNTWWLNHLFFTDMQRQGKRPLLFHRWGGLGNHRYQVGFSGDTYTTWKTLSFQPAFTATASNVGYGYWSHDIGGHQISSTDPADIKDGELFLRWMQFGVFSPILRTHSTKKAEIDRRFWNFKNEYQDIVELVKLRYTLNPYIYTASRDAYDSGVSICHPLYYGNPESPAAYEFTNEYYFGDKMIVSPVVNKADSNTRLVKQKIWLPMGEWEEWFSGYRLQGDKIYNRAYAKTEIPLFVKAGSVIPAFPREIKNLQHLSDTVILYVFPGNGNGRLYNDDGETDAYRQGKYARTTFTQSRTGVGTTLYFGPQYGSYKGMKDSRTWIIKVNKSFPPASVVVDGIKYPYNESFKAGTWTYSGDKFETIITLPSGIATRGRKIIITDLKMAAENAYLLEGQRRFINRMKVAMEMIKFEISAVDWGAAIPDRILHVESLPVRIGYHPELAIEYLKENDQNIKGLRNVIMQIPDIKKERLQNICDFLELP